VPLLPLVLILAAALAAGRLPRRAPALRALQSRWAPVAVGALTSAFHTWIWGGLRVIPVLHDEAAYVLQARIFAGGRWAAPSPPLPEFFEQFHVFVTPALAPKYPPGHALVMVPGAWLGVPGLVPVLLSGLSAALIFILGRRLVGPGAGLAAAVLWATAPGVLRWIPTYFSQGTTTALWLLSWWLLLRWRRTRRPGLLAALSAAVALGGITRPLTMIVFALPVAAVVLWDVVRGRLWRQTAVALAAGLAVCAIVPLWSAGTLGDWRRNPYREYSRVYFPFDAPGFGPDSTAPQRPLPPDMTGWMVQGGAMRAAHVPATLPRALRLRTRVAWRDAFRGWRVWLAVAAIAAMLMAPAAAYVALATCALLLLAYLLFYAPPSSSLYYAEAQPVLAFFAALGLARAAGAYARRTSPGVEAEAGARRDWMMAAMLLAMLPGFAADAGVERRGRAHLRASQEEFLAQVRTLPDRSVVFVRYGPLHNNHLSLIRNEPDAARARVWTVYDRGADNARLLRTAPDRVPFLYDEASKRMVRLRE
jgi:hypothetical protein